MSELSARLRQVLAQRARKVSEHLGREVQTRYKSGVSEGPCYWLDAKDDSAAWVSLAYLSAPLTAKGYSYTVGRPGELPPHSRFTFDSDAARAFQAEALATAKALGLYPPRSSRNVADAVQGTKTYTAEEAVKNPVIRATVIASHEAERTAGTSQDALAVLNMAHAALRILEARCPGSASDPAKASESERALIRLLTCALTE